MKLKYEAIKGQRINYMFCGITTFENGWWYNIDLKKWELNPKHGLYNRSSHQPCRSLKAFKRKLKKLPKGVEFILASRFKNHNVIRCAKAETPHVIENES
jgi:hypothetical protein